MTAQRHMTGSSDHDSQTKELRISTVDVSVIIPSIGRKSLALTLCSLRHQTLPADRFEVIVVDDESGNDYSAVEGEYRLVVAAGGHGPAHCRNVGVQAATGKIVAFTDDDCVVPPDWLERFVEAFTLHPEISAAGGYLVPHAHALVQFGAARLDLWDLARTGALDASESIQPSQCSMAWGTNNLSWRRDELMALGGFSKRMKVGEDSDLAERAGNAGHRSLFLPVQVSHHRNYCWTAHWHQHKARGYRTYRLHGKRSPIRALLRLAPAVIRSVRLARTGDLGLCGASLTKDIAFSVGLVSRGDDIEKS